ncbi:KH domain-containing protein [Cucumis melo var. makuwa]|uniref:KH domain-containing protein n=1 Tax=Cucumis melo var. makuwa TaxID=1194695 RepID=A0A5A7V4Q5_CUCMM|nr:KH domain-containing protein [Cucumis melo var. makuwa]TYK01473.1 KH domain-containing protein [Cucumis melo var. makuwa]
MDTYETLFTFLGYVLRPYVTENVRVESVRGGSWRLEVLRNNYKVFSVIRKNELHDEMGGDMSFLQCEEVDVILISGDLVVVKEALVHIVTRLIANLFYREVALSAVLLYLPLTTDGSDSLSYDGKEGKRHGRGHSYSSGFGDFNDLAGGDGYESYSGSQIHILTLTCLIIAMGTVEKKPYEDKAVELKAEYEKTFESQNGKNEDDDKEVEEIGEKEVE